MILKTTHSLDFCVMTQQSLSVQFWLDIPHQISKLKSIALGILNVFKITGLSENARQLLRKKILVASS